MYNIYVFCKYMNVNVCACIPGKKITTKKDTFCLLFSLQFLLFRDIFFQMWYLLIRMFHNTNMFLRQVCCGPKACSRPGWCWRRNHTWQETIIHYWMNTHVRLLVCWLVGRSVFHTYQKEGSYFSMLVYRTSCSPYTRWQCIMKEKSWNSFW